MSNNLDMSTWMCYCRDMPTTPSFRVYNAEALGQAVKFFREHAGLTQAELAERVGIQRSYLAELEAGEMTEQTRRLVKLLKAVGARLIVTEAEW